MAQLVLGPLLRYVSETHATVWVETDAPCTVSVLTGEATTFCVESHHYALVQIEDLAPGTTTPYEVALDGERAWPENDDRFPHCAIRTLPGDGERLRLAFGSCRVSVPHHEPYTLRKDQDERGREIDALYALVQRMLRLPDTEWPHVALCLGDQVYADEVSPDTREFIRSRRSTKTGPGEEIADFEEYTVLYRESWTDPALRWFFSTVSSSMIWDDHDVHDDWNTSHDWVQTMRSKPWWDARITGAVMSYWIYQHLGNLSPGELADNELWQEVCRLGDAGERLRDFARRADRENQGTRWSYHRDLGRTRLIVLDSRAGRLLEPGERSMVDADEWAWIVKHAHGDFDHLLLASSLPMLLAPGMHHLEAWNEAVCEGAWGSLGARVGERIRQGLDLEHWAAFDRSFDALAALMQSVAIGENGAAPATVVALSGDVHHAYLADVAFRRGSAARSAVYQAVCSPVRNPLNSRERRVIKAMMSRPAHAVTHTLARAAGCQDPAMRWRICEGPWFDNQIATLDLEGREVTFRIEKARPGAGDHRHLETVLERRLS